MRTRCEQRFRLAVCCAALMLVLVATVANAQVHPNVERGIAVDKLYQFGDIDQINVFNGNLSLRIPIGASSTVSEHLSYALTLVYNSKIWDSERFVIPDGLNDVTFHRFPSRLCNAGLGWKLSLGTLLDPSDTVLNPSSAMRYEAPDGSSHGFYASLHPTDAANGDFYTLDGSYLRLSSLGSNMLLEFPDGIRHEFEPYYVDVNNVSIKRWRVRTLRDRFGNHVDVDYTDPSAWVITDQYQRKTTVHFAPAPTPPPGDDAVTQENYQTVVDYVDVPAFAGVTALTPATTARYGFSYATQSVMRSYCDNEGRISTTFDPDHVEVPLLTGIQLPDGSRYVPAYAHPTTDLCASGDIVNLQLPTYGQLQWTWREYQLPIKGCDSPEALNQSAGVGTRTLSDPAGASPAATWTYSSQLTPEPATSWRCGPQNQWEWGSPPSDELKTTVTAPTGDQTVHYFSVWPPFVTGAQPPDAGASVLDYGLPFSPKASKDGKFIATQMYQGSAVGGVLKRTTYVRYERDDGGITYGGAGLGPQYDLDRRLADSRTEFNDDLQNGQPHYVETDSSDFDGVGHYRTTTERATFGNGTARTTTTAYNTAAAGINAGDSTVLATGTYRNGGGSFALPPASSPWILDLFPSRTITEGTSSAVQQYCFAPATGFLKGTRTLLGSMPGSTDLIHAFVTDSNFDGGAVGNVTGEKSYGGDATPITSGAGEFCTMVAAPDATTPGPIVSDIRHTFQSGVRKTSDDYAGGVSMGFHRLDVDIDRNTGLVFHSRDTAGVQTTYQYDSSRRVSSIARTGVATTNYEYLNATGGAGSAFSPFTVNSSTASSTGALRSQFVLDGLGRLMRESHLGPGGSSGTWSAFETKYDELGRKKSVSEPESTGSTAPSGSLTATFKTTNTYDVFGRTATVTAPDGSLTTFGYTGVRATTKTTSVATAADGTTSPSTTTSDYDGEGRLVTVQEPSGPGSGALGASVTAQYQYDVGSRLSSVKMTSGAVVQNRVFDYDGRGFLRWESHPESGMTAYSYDARGNVVAKTQSAAGTLFDLQYTYDGAGRLTNVYGRNPQYIAGNSSPDAQQFRPIKELTYAGDNDTSVTPNDLRRGKLLTAVRYNYPPDPPIPFTTGSYVTGIIRVTETYQYADAAGRKTKRTTAIDQSPSLSGPWTSLRTIVQGVAYNDLDLPQTIDYPTCVGCGLPPDNPDRHLTPAYDQGRVISVPDFVTSVSYWPNGLRNELLHTNDIKDSQTLDRLAADGSTGLARPGSISSAYYTQCTPPGITSDPQGGSTTSATPSITLQVTASGTAPMSYQWYSYTGSGLLQTIAGATGPSYVAAPTVTTTYYVTISNSCRTISSRWVTVTVGNCTVPTIGNVTVTRNADNTVTLHVEGGSGTEPYTFTWYQSSNNALVGSGRTVTAGPISANTSWYLQMANPCNTATTSASVSFPLPVPTGVVASKSGANQITVSWPAVAGAATYYLERRSGSGWSGLLANGTAASSYVDGGLTSNTTYAYRIYAVDASGGSRSAYSNVDIATTMTFTSVTSGMTVQAAQFDELLQAVNAVRAAAGWASVTWSDILAEDQPLPAPSVRITASHLLALRGRMNDALEALGAPAGGYSNPDPSLQTIHVTDITELQGRAQ